MKPKERPIETVREDNHAELALRVQRCTDSFKQLLLEKAELLEKMTYAQEHGYKSEYNYYKPSYDELLREIPQAQQYLETLKHKLLQTSLTSPSCNQQEGRSSIQSGKDTKRR